MSELQRARLVLPTTGGPVVMEASVKEQLAKYFWAWYRVHAQDHIVKVKILFFSVTVRVATIRPLFVILFGVEV